MPMTPATGTVPSWCTLCWMDCLSSLWTPRLVRIELGRRVGQPWGQAPPDSSSLPLGVVRTAIPNMDRETQEEFLVVIQAKDMGGHMGGLSGSTTVTVTLSDVNDNPPKFPQSKGQVPRLSRPLTNPQPYSLGRSLPHPSPSQAWEKDVLGEGGGPGTSLRTSPSIHSKACTSSPWWRPLGRAPWWAGCGPRTQTWGTTPSWHTASWMGRGPRPSASAQTPRVEMASSLSARLASRLLALRTHSHLPPAPWDTLLTGLEQARSGSLCWSLEITVIASSFR